MPMSSGVESALHCTWLLAQGTDRTLPGHRLAEFHGLAPAYLSKILKLLTHADVLQAVPGVGGGYRLSRAPERITLLDVVEAVEGSALGFRCQELRRRGPAALSPAACDRPCGIASVMHRADDAWRRELAATTLSDLHGHAATASVERARRWLAEVDPA